MDRKIIIFILVVASTIAQNIPAVTPALLLGTLAKASEHRLFICFLDRQELGSGANSAKRPVELRKIRILVNSSFHTRPGVLAQDGSNYQFRNNFLGRVP